MLSSELFNKLLERCYPSTDRVRMLKDRIVGFGEYIQVAKVVETHEKSIKVKPRYQYRRGFRSVPVEPTLQTMEVYQIEKQQRYFRGPNSMIPYFKIEVEKPTHILVNSVSFF